jgi:hypothetical protein
MSDETRKLKQAILRLARESLAGPLGYWERIEAQETIERIERELEEAK